MPGEVVLNVGADAAAEPAFVQQPPIVTRASDPVISPAASTPVDFAAQFPNPLDQTELLAMCEEVNVLRSIPEVNTGLKTYTWREMTSLAFTSGSSKRTFADGLCPEEYTHDGSNLSVDLKNVGAKKGLTISDIMHSVASISAGYGINRLMGGWDGSSGMPGGTNQPSLLQATVASVKSKEMTLASVLTLNALDTLLVNGDKTANALEFDGIESIITGSAGAHLNTNITGAFSADVFDRFLGEGCAKPTHIFGHPAAIQSMLSAYFQLGFSGSQLIEFNDGNRITPGFNFAGQVNTGVGRLTVVADSNFARTDTGGGTFRSNLYPLRMTHNGEPLVYKITQIPLSFQDLVPGCTAIQFEIWTKTALVVKALCAQSRYSAIFTGNIVTTCNRVGI